jgi:hypothetical protein
VISGASAVNTRAHSTTTFAREAAGALGIRHSPRLLGGRFFQRLGRIAPRGANVRLKFARREATASSELSSFFAASKLGCFAEPLIGRMLTRVRVTCDDGLRILGRGCLKSESESMRRAEARRMLWGRPERCRRSTRHHLCPVIPVFAEKRLSQLSGNFSPFEMVTADHHYFCSCKQPVLTGQGSNMKVCS